MESVCRTFWARLVMQWDPKGGVTNGLAHRVPREQEEACKCTCEHVRTMATLIADWTCYRGLRDKIGLSNRCLPTLRVPP